MTNYNQLYGKIIKYMVSSGKRIKKRAGHIEDIGITKKYLTEEDIKIERGLKKIIKNFSSKHEFYAEEENFNFVNADDVWVGDPISGTGTFIRGLTNYGMAIAHVHSGDVHFAVVYDPSVNELYTAYKGKGAYLNGKLLRPSTQLDNKPCVLFHLTKEWKDDVKSAEMFRVLAQFNLYRTWMSQAVSWCHVAKGTYSGMVCFSKDNFPEFAGSLIIKEAGGTFSNINGDFAIKPTDRIFIGADNSMYTILKSLVEKIVNNNC